MSTRKLAQAAEAFDAAVAEEWFPARGALAASEVLDCAPAEALNALVLSGHLKVGFFLTSGSRDNQKLWVFPAPG